MHRGKDVMIAVLLSCLLLLLLLLDYLLFSRHYSEYGYGMSATMSPHKSVDKFFLFN